MAAPKLKKVDRDKMLEMIAAREDYATIAQVIGCSVQNVRYHGSQYAGEIEILQAARDAEFLNKGHMAWQNRVKSLARLAKRIERRLGNVSGAEHDLDLDEKLDAEEIKMAGNGSQVRYKVFNKPEVDAFRGVLDDLAKETGGRISKTDVTNSDGTLSTKQYVLISPDDWPVAQDTSNGTKTG